MRREEMVYHISRMFEGHRQQLPTMSQLDVMFRQLERYSEGAMRHAADRALLENRLPKFDRLANWVEEVDERHKLEQKRAWVPIIKESTECDPEYGDFRLWIIRELILEQKKTPREVAVVLRENQEKFKHLGVDLIGEAVTLEALGESWIPAASAEFKDARRQAPDQWA